MYTPDFFLKDSSAEVYQIIEVKGYFDPASRAKIRRLRKYYPEDFKKLTIIANKKDKKVTDFCKEMKLELYAYEQVLADLDEAGIKRE